MTRSRGNDGRKCRNCEFWDVAKARGDACKMSRCRVSPPERDDSAGEYDATAAWPISFEDDWCGSFVVRGTK